MTDNRGCFHPADARYAQRADELADIDIYARDIMAERDALAAKVAEREGHVRELDHIATVHLRDLAQCERERLAAVESATTRARQRDEARAELVSLRTQLDTIRELCDAFAAKHSCNISQYPGLDLVTGIRRVLDGRAVPEESKEGGEHHGDGPCMDCGGLNLVVWFTDNVLWNDVVGGPGTTDDPGGLLCIPCFVRRAERRYAMNGWRLVPEWPWPARWMEPARGGGVSNG